MKEIIKVTLFNTLLASYIVNLVVMFCNTPMETLVANVSVWIIIGMILTFVWFIKYACE